MIAIVHSHLLYSKHLTLSGLSLLNNTLSHHAGILFLSDVSPVVGSSTYLYVGRKDMPGSLKSARRKAGLLEFLPQLILVEQWCEFPCCDSREDGIATVVDPVIEVSGEETQFVVENHTAVTAADVGAWIA